MLHGEFPGTLPRETTSGTIQSRIILNHLGPTSVGKGYQTSQIERYFKIGFGLTTDIIGTGELVRNRFNTDAAFKEEWFDRVKKGELVSDEEIAIMFDQQYVHGPNNGFMLNIDGFPRSSSQMPLAQERGILEKNSATLIYHASLETCLERALHRAKTKPGGARFDDDAVISRYWLHQRELRHIERFLSTHTNTFVVHIDANKPLEEISHDILPIIGAMIQRVGLSHLKPTCQFTTPLPTICAIGATLPPIENQASTK